MPLVQKPKSLELILKQRDSIININNKVKDEFSRLDSIAFWITEHVGTMGFFIVIFVWTLLWLSWNILAPKPLRFDPFPAFVLWLFISNMLQIFLMPLLMIGQNLQGKHSEARAENDFNINVKAEREIEVILQHLEYQNSLILKIVEKLEDSSKTK